MSSSLLESTSSRFCSRCHINDWDVCSRCQYSNIDLSSPDSNTLFLSSGSILSMDYLFYLKTRLYRNDEDIHIVCSECHQEIEGTVFRDVCDRCICGDCLKRRD